MTKNNYYNNAISEWLKPLGLIDREKERYSEVTTLSYKKKDDDKKLIELRNLIVSLFSHYKRPSHYGKNVQTENPMEEEYKKWKNMFPILPILYKRDLSYRIAPSYYIKSSYTGRMY